MLLEVFLSTHYESVEAQTFGQFSWKPPREALVCFMCDRQTLGRAGLSTQPAGVSAEHSLSQSSFNLFQAQVNPDFYSEAQAHTWELVAVYIDSVTS